MRIEEVYQKSSAVRPPCEWSNLSQSSRETLFQRCAETKMLGDVKGLVWVETRTCHTQIVNKKVNEKMMSL